MTGRHAGYRVVDMDAADTCDLDLCAGITLLRERRGEEGVTFGEVADHLVDFVTRSPAHVAMVDRLANYLAYVRSEAHEHDAPDAPGGSSLSEPA
jgi:hypothetical protein